MSLKLNAAHIFDGSEKGLAQRRATRGTGISGSGGCWSSSMQGSVFQVNGAKEQRTCMLLHRALCVMKPPYT